MKKKLRNRLLGSAKLLFKMTAIVALVSVIFYSCQKQDVQTGKETGAKKEETMEELKKRGLAIDGPQPLVTIIPLNLEGKAFLVNPEGNRLTAKNFTTGNGGTSNLAPCVAPGDIDDVGYTVTLQSIASTYSCADGTSFKETWIVRSPYALVQQSPFNSSNQSFGRIRIRNSSNAVVYTSPAYSPVTISAPTTDPTNPDRNEYIVTFTTGYLSKTTLSSGSTFEHRLQVYTDCNQQSVALGVQLATSANIGETTPPCQKIDRVGLNPPSSPYFAYARLIGCNATPCYDNNPDALPNGHEIQWRNVGDGDADWRYTNWRNTYTSSQYIGNPSTQVPGSISNADYMNIEPARLFAEKVYGAVPTTNTQLTAFPANTIEIRYRNVMWDLANYPPAQRKLLCASVYWSAPVVITVQ